MKTGMLKEIKTPKMQTNAKAIFPPMLAFCFSIMNSHQESYIEIHAMKNNANQF